jgi:hypothetical protein
MTAHARMEHDAAGILDHHATDPSRLGAAGTLLEGDQRPLDVFIAEDGTDRPSQATYSGSNPSSSQNSRGNTGALVRLRTATCECTREGGPPYHRRSRVSQHEVRGLSRGSPSMR